jgi:Ca-activated chloride channel homolog
MKRPLPPRRLEVARRRGAILVVAVALMIAFVATVALSLDVAYMELTRSQLRIATDAAARAAGEALSRTQNLATATQAAKDVALSNLVDGQPLKLADEDVVSGNASRAADSSWNFTQGGTPVNAIRILGRKTSDSPSKSIKLYFGSLFGIYEFEPSLHATVVRADRDLCLVVDRSSSMKLGLSTTTENMSTSDPRFCQVPDPVDSRWAALSDAIEGFVEELGNTQQIEYVGLASYASDYTSCGYTNAASTINLQLASNASQLNTAIQAISATTFNGLTDIAGGIDKGAAALTNTTHARPFALKTMVLMTDGNRTAGGDPVVAANAAGAKHIVIHTITFGNGADQAAMQQVAAATGGKHYHAPDAAALEAVFREIALSLSVTFVD